MIRVMFRIIHRVTESRLEWNMISLRGARASVTCTNKPSTHRAACRSVAKCGTIGSGKIVTPSSVRSSVAHPEDGKPRWYSSGGPIGSRENPWM